MGKRTKEEEMARILEEIEFLLISARADASESHSAAMNSYGAGYDSGFAEALRVSLNIVLNKDE